MDALKKQLEKKVNAYKTAASQASQELSSAEVRDAYACIHIYICICIPIVMDVHVYICVYAVFYLYHVIICLYCIHIHIYT